jgi:hypothetical protein
MSRKHDPATQCHHIGPRGQRCRMLRAPNHESLCTHHLKQSSAAQPDHETLAAELLADTGYLSTAREVNALIANLVRQVAYNRIDRKDAMAFGFLSQLLLSSLTPLGKQIEAEEEAERQREFAPEREERRAAYLAQPAAWQEAANSPQPPKTYADVRT